LWLYGTRAYLARQMDLDDLPSRREILAAGGDFDPVDEAIINRRDARLLEHLQQAYQDQTPDAPRVIGVVWGARHMRAVTRLLMGKLKYRVATAEWITVFTL